MALTDNLAAYWPLDEASGTRNDSHGSSHLTDVNTVGSGTGKINGGASFVTADNDALTVASNAAIVTGDINYTLSAWFYFTSVPSSFGVIAKETSSGSREWRLDFDNFRPRFIVFSSSGVAGAATWATGISLNTWYHVVAWHDATNNQVGISVNNGTPVTSATSAAAASSGSTLYFGKIPGLSHATYIADEVGFWKRLLTSTERADLYNGGAGLAYSSFAGGGGSPTVELSGAISAQSTGSAALTITRPLSGSVSGSSSVTGEPQITRLLAGSISAASTVAGEPQITRTLSGAIAAQSTVAGAVEISRQFAGSIQGEATVVGALTVAGSLQLAGAISASSTVTGDLEITRPLSGAIAAQSTVTGGLHITRPLAGSISSTATVTGTPQISRDLAGAIVGQTSIVGQMLIARPFSGIVVGQGTVSGVLSTAEIVLAAGRARVTFAAAPPSVGFVAVPLKITFREDT